MNFLLEQYIVPMAKQLPPSSSRLKMLDIGATTFGLVAAQRDDIHPVIASLRLSDWDYPNDAFDAVVGCDINTTPDMLAAILRVLRPGGRFVCVLPAATVDEIFVKRLEDNGFTRILVESVIDHSGVLMRGEKPHTTTDTLERVESVAQSDAQQLDVAQYRGRYIYLLIKQQPNVPRWKLRESDNLTWHAVAVEQEPAPVLLGFSSLPRAVSFMQAAVLAGTVSDVNQMPRFKPQTVSEWQRDIIINPEPEYLNGRSIVDVPVDPDDAEEPEE